MPVNFKCATGAWNLARETRYLYDDRTVVQERDQNNVPTLTYTRGLDLSGSFQGAGGIGGLLARTAYDTATPPHAYYHADGNGNITALINTQQAIVATYLYDPFGNTLAKAGLLADANTMRFSSKDWHNGSFLYCFGFRFYDPNLQRWVNRDPIEERGGINLFRPLGGNPIEFIDPYGFDFGAMLQGTSMAGLYPCPGPCSGGQQLQTDDAGRQCCPNQMQSINLNSDLRLPIPHSFIQTPNITVGYYPEWTHIPYAPGYAKNDTDHHRSTSQTYRACPASVAAVEQSINNNQGDTMALTIHFSGEIVLLGPADGCPMVDFNRPETSGYPSKTPGSAIDPVCL